MGRVYHEYRQNLAIQDEPTFVEILSDSSDDDDCCDAHMFKDLQDMHQPPLSFSRTPDPSHATFFVSIWATLNYRPQFARAICWPAMDGHERPWPAIWRAMAAAMAGQLRPSMAGNGHPYMAGHMAGHCRGFALLYSHLKCFAHTAQAVSQLGCTCQPPYMSRRSHHG